ncbi:T9SS type A sorting domain-containing protein [Haliscomenobacter sp.]|uniref:T9SS type A sorting domain-containing protein n=1 Tax=Haliscomenobacter sp. TaxID=2717303 RepID=UPI003BAD2441
MAIERSFDGELFSEVGQVKGRGTTLIPFTYSFVDYSASEGVNYYRLRQVDFDKSIQYSKVIAINAPGSNDIFAFPNPAKDKITLQYDYSKGAGNIQLYDALGRRINASIAGYAGNYEVKLPEGLAKGTYWLKVERGGQVQTVPVVKE